jgi:pimeloyl-ACP methyl ester carboxylesterase
VASLPAAAGARTGDAASRSPDAAPSSASTAQRTAARLAIDAGDWGLALITENLFDAHAATFGTCNVNRRNGELKRFLTPMTARTIRVVMRREPGGKERRGHERCRLPTLRKSGQNKGGTMKANEALNIVLVHGGFVDASGWEGVYQILKRDGHNVSVVQNPTSSLADDVAVTKLALSLLDGPALLVGHSYGGAVITEAGTDSKVVGLVYIAAFAPSDGESVNALIKNPVPGAPVPPILPPVNGFLFLDKSKFHAAFAGDVDAAKAAFMADSQVPWGVGALDGTISKAAWKTKPSWYMVTKDDRMIPPDAQRFMAKRAGATVVEEKGSHAVYVSRPEVVAEFIAKAASGVTVGSA